jgi:hypothetical protein
VDGHAAVVGDAQCPDQLLEIGTVVFVVAVDNARSFAAVGEGKKGTATFLRS